MGIRRTITVVVSVSALVLLSVPGAVSAGAEPASAAWSARHYYATSGKIEMVLAPAFLEQVQAAGATVSSTGDVTISVDKASGLSIASMPTASYGSVVLNTSKSIVDMGGIDGITITGNGSSVEMSYMGFAITSASGSTVTAGINDGHMDIGVGPRSKLPKQATRNRLSVTSSLVMVTPDFADVLRNGPVPSMTTDAIPLGMFRLTLKVKAGQPPRVDVGGGGGGES